MACRLLGTEPLTNANIFNWNSIKMQQMQNKNMCFEMSSTKRDLFV